jgi:NADH-quinone oxidoreductase subunit J
VTTTVLFWAFAVIAVVSATLCISRRSPLASALWLVVTLFALSAIYVALDAQFIGVLQVMVYAGAIMVLFLFVIMLLNLGRGGPSDVKGPVGLAVATGLGGWLFVQLRAVTDAGPPAAIPARGPWRPCNRSRG